MKSYYLCCFNDLGLWGMGYIFFDIYICFISYFLDIYWIWESWDIFLNFLKIFFLIVDVIFVIIKRYDCYNFFYINFWKV